jgi:hypothetical protein
MATSWLARRMLAALRNVERQADLVAEILAPGPLGPPSIKWPRETQEAAEQAVEAAKQRWAQSHAKQRASQCAPSAGSTADTREP